MFFYINIIHSFPVQCYGAVCLPSEHSKQCLVIEQNCRVEQYGSFKPKSEENRTNAPLIPSDRFIETWCKLLLLANPLEHINGSGKMAVSNLLANLPGARPFYCNNAKLSGQTSGSADEYLSRKAWGCSFNYFDNGGNCLGWFVDTFGLVSSSTLHPWNSGLKTKLFCRGGSHVLCKARLFPLLAWGLLCTQKASYGTKSVFMFMLDRSRLH